MAVPCDCCPAAGITACYSYDPGGVPTNIELLANGDLSQSTGIGATSSIGPGWSTSYAPCGPNIFSVPCGASTYAFFTTNAGQVTGNFASAIPLYARGGRSMAVNVGPNTAIPIIEWSNISLVNGQAYRFKMAAGIIGNPFSVAMRIDGGAQGIFPITAPSTVSQWEDRIVNFTFTGPTGNYPVGLYSNSGVAGGNDHVFDDFSLIAVHKQAFLFVCDNQEIRWFDAESGDELSPTEIATLRDCGCNPRQDNTNFTVSGAGPFTWAATEVAPATLSYYNYGDRVTQWEGQYSSPGAPASWRINAPEIAGDLDPDGFSPPLAASEGPGYVGTKTQGGVTITLETLAGNLLPNFAANRWGSFGGANGAHMRVTFSQPVTLSIIGGPDLGDGPNEALVNVQATQVPTCI